MTTPLPCDQCPACGAVDVRAAACPFCALRTERDRYRTAVERIAPLASGLSARLDASRILDIATAALGADADWARIYGAARAERERDAAREELAALRATVKRYVLARYVTLRRRDHTPDEGMDETDAWVALIRALPVVADAP